MKSALSALLALVAALSLQPAQSLEVDACQRLNNMRANLTEMLKRYTEKHPSVIAQRRDIAQLLAAIKADGANSPEDQICPPPLQPKR